MPRRLALLVLLVALVPGVVPARATTPGANGVIAFNTCQSGSFGTVNPDGSGRADLPLWSPPEQNSFRPLAFSPDGNTVLIAHKEADPPPGGGLNEYAVYATPLDGSAPTRLTPLGESAYDATWSPDGRQIAYITNRDTPPGTLQGELYVLDIATGARRRLTTNGSYDDHPDWAPDGSRIAIAASTGDFAGEILLVDPVAGAVTPLTATADAAEHEPSWSPDSSRIAFTRALASGAAEIYTMARDGSDPRRLTTGGYRDNSPVWSPDGTRIAYDHPFGQISVFGGFGNVLTMRASDGGDQRDVTRYTTAAPRFACPTSWQACHAGVTKRCTSPLVAQVTPPPPSPSPRPTSSPSPSPRPPGAAPVVSRLRVSPGRFRAARSGAPVKAAVRTGARVGYRLNVAARVRFVVGRAHPGRRVGRRCVRPTRGNRSRGRCIRLVRVRGSFRRNRPAGADRFRFTARLGGRTLRPGRYALVAAATARGRTGSPAAARFRIVR